MARPFSLPSTLRASVGRSVHARAPLIARQRHHDAQTLQEIKNEDTDFILSILKASPSKRDSRSYLSSFAPPQPKPQPSAILESNSATPATTDSSQNPPKEPQDNLVHSLLNPVYRRPALVKVQGPFTDPQLDSICRGLAHLRKLGLVPVIVVDRDDLPATDPADKFEAQRQRAIVRHEVERVVQFLTRHRAPARPVFSTVARISDPELEPEEAQKGVFVEDEGLDHIRRAVGEGEIPVLLPVALDSGCRSRRIQSNKVLLALASAMSATSSSPVDLTPRRLLIINREGGIPSYARRSFPHLYINLASEFTYINRTWLPQWNASHPTALANLSLAKGCLAHMPRGASALVVSHRSPTALIANLITNKPAHSASLPHALLVESEGRITRHTPTLIRKGLPVRVLRTMDEVDEEKLTVLLESSFGRTLDREAFYQRLRNDLDFVIVIGDYAGAAVCTLEGKPSNSSAPLFQYPPEHPEPICYLDKFAVHPSHQGDGTVDFLWVALRDETYGLGQLDASNPSIGSLRGVGRGRDLVWRSRGDNPVNKWYYERSSGFVRTQDQKWKVFWCDAEQRLNRIWEQREFGGGRLVRVLEKEEKGRVEWWEEVIAAIPSAWAK
ncbi:amino-acid acetyltransferase, mitochondrial [Cryptococcus amylolentus CBS 6039]|uniref:Amino-acid acetyltransferase, mitochondrial n=1 Tax=Cryptococcus amylolentus CBS 6039 TaxID=1295533 RepID=A0A1E3I704_9TREE|nr:amino-acid acetyltransferase, mitochondrial [Cryptococcus amylolentus CBS 6039]ODN84347.1 amino-acid acetyltransferase, mitochondrial [Cryptococcus amylolentus CBS 6039]